MVMPSQNALKFPATRPDRILREAPPSREDVTTSLTCEESTEVNTFTSSGIIAPARVPQVMMVESFHHMVGSLPRSGIIKYERAYVAPIEMKDVSHTSEVKGAS